MPDDVIYVFGHRHPDTDTICSAIAYAELKNKMGYNAQPRRLGEINKETAFILDYFNVEVPPLLDTVKTQIKDLNIDIVDQLSPDVSIKTAWSIMDKNESKTLPVVDDDEKLIGIVSISDVTEKYMDVFDYNSIATCGTSLENVLETISGTLYVGKNEWFRSSGKVVVAASSPGSLSEYIEKGDIVIVGDHEDCQMSALELGANCLVVTCSHKPGEEVKKLAEKNNAIIVVTELDTYTVVRLINQSIPVGSIMCKNDEGSKIVKFCIDDFVENIKELMVKNRYRSYPVLYPDGRVAGLISRFHLISQRKKKVILLDHNEKSQTAPGIEEAEVLEIIDHHKIGDLTTSAPILFKNEPVGSTSTIIANMYIDMGRRPSVSIAGILCAAIISDTLKFESPTATDYDRRTAEKLAAIAGINIDEFADRMFTAGSSLKGKTPKEIYSQDFKRVSFNDYHMGVSQITILNMDLISEEKPEIVEYMTNAAFTDHFDLLALMITELSTKKTELWLAGPLADTILKDLGAQDGQRYLRYDRLMSRKKDVIPLLDSAVEKLNM